MADVSMKAGVVLVVIDPPLPGLSGKQVTDT